MGGVGKTRIVHLHIPKTAGTALRSAFEKAGDGLRVFPHYDERQYADIDITRFDFYSGHFGYKTATMLDGQIVTVLRNPVERFISVYYFWRQLYEKGVEKSQNTLLATKFPLSEFVKIRDEPSLLEEFYNRMTWQVAYGSSLALRREFRAAGNSEQDVFKQAVANLASFAIVGVQERLPLFEAAVAKKFDVPLKIRRENVTDARPAVEDIGMDTIKAIQSWTFMDLEFYQYANRLISETSGT